MKRLRLFAAALLALTSVAFSATLTPIQLLNPAGSTSGQLIVSTGPSTAPAWGNISVGSLSAQAANSVLANVTGSPASPTAVIMPSCSTANSALKYTSGTGFSCGTTFALTSGTLAQFAATTSAQLAGIISDETGSGSLVFGTSPTLGTPTINTPTLSGGTINNASIGATTPSTGSFTTLTASSTLTGFPGRLLNVQIFTASGTYTPTTGTNKIIVEVQAAAGGTGGTAATAAGQNAASAGGAAGSYARVLLTSGFSGATVTIGAVGTAGTAGANAGGTAAATSFGAIISCPGGTGGGGGTAISALGQSGAPAAQTANCTVGSGTAINLTPGQASSSGVVYGIGNLLFGGAGGNSALGVGGQAIGSTAANAGSGYGAGASGIIALASAAAAAGTTGKPGIVIVWEFS